MIEHHHLLLHSRRNAFCEDVSHNVRVERCSANLFTSSYYDADANLDVLKDKTIVFLG